MRNDDFSGEVFAIYFYLYKGCSFSKNYNFVKVSKKFWGVLN